MQLRRTLTVAACLSVGTVALGGCAGTRMLTPVAGPHAAAARQYRASQPIPYARRTPPNEQISVVNRIDRRVNAAAVRVCQRSFTNPETCPSLLGNRKLAVDVSDSRINAFVGSRFDITLLGGLIANAGSDDEIASVLAHEYSHALLGHVAKSSRNAGWGAVAGALAGIAIGAMADDPEYVEHGASIGQQIGSRVFSKAMENTADHFGMFILHEAGYDIRAAARFHIRLARLQGLGWSTGENGTLGFLGTHPSPEQRIEKLMATEEMIARGARTPVWKKK